jgi:hypothetical protein
MDKIVESARKNYKSDSQAWSDIYQKGKDDLFFLSDDEFAQWNGKEAKARADTGRPILTIDQLSQFVHQVANDIRQNTPSINVIPSNTGDEETADVFKGLIRNIEYVSAADDAYDTASLSSIKGSIGFIRVDHDYIDDESFNQELCIKRVVNPFSIMIDAESIEVDGSDAKRGYVIETITVDEFKSRYPGKEVSCFEAEEQKAQYEGDDKVSICEYYEIVESDKQYGMLEDGEPEELQEGKEYKKTRTMKRRTVKRCTLSGKETLEETTFPGKYIPIVPVYGEEAWIEGKRHLFSLIRKSKDAQRMFNYWKSTETELLQRQPKAYTMVAEGQIEDYIDDWENPDKAVALTYKTKDLEGNPIAPPQMLNPSPIPVGVINASRGAVDDIKATMGIYNAALGQVSNETSGIAITRRKEEGDVATFHFSDNLNKSIAQVGRILVSAIPEIYDTPRIIRIIGKEEETKSVGINGKMEPDQEQEFDLTQGSYDVKVVTGASFSTKRQETAEFLNTLVARSPEFMQIAGDILFQNMDIAGAPALAERMKKLVDPKLLDEENEVDPEKEQMAAIIQQGEVAIQELNAKIGQMEQELKSKQADLMIKAKAEENDAEYDRAKIEVDKLKLQIEQQKLLLERERMETERTKIERESQYKMTALALKERELNERQVNEVDEVIL